MAPRYCAGAHAVGGATDDRAKIQMDRASIRTPAPAGPPWRATALIHPPLQKAIGKERRMTGISRRAVLRGAAALSGLGALEARYLAAQALRDAPCAEHALPPGSDHPSRAALAPRQGRFFGAAVSRS